MNSFFNFLRKIIQNHYMIRSLVIRDIRSRYIGSLVGLFWSIIHPLFQIAIYYFVFSVILKVKLGPEYGGTHFAVWLIVGLLPWLLFSEVIMRAPGAILEQATLIKKTVFPSEILPFSYFAAALLNHFIALVIVGILVMFSDGRLSKNTLLLIFYLGGIGLFAMGLSWILSALNVFLRDVGQVIGVFLNVWFYFTPIIYPKSMVPENFQTFLELNPMLHAVEGYRVVLLGRTGPSMYGLLYLWMVGLLFFGIGGVTFKKLKPAFADVL